MPSPVLAEELMRGRIDLAFMRAEAGHPELTYRVIATEALKAIVPSNHRLAASEAIGIEDLVGETLIGMSKTAPVLQAVIDDYLKRAGVELNREYEIANLGMAMSLVASTRSVTLLPAFADNFLPWSVTSRPLKEKAPIIDLVIGYRRHNDSPQLQAILARVDDLISRGSRSPRP